MSLIEWEISNFGEEKGFVVFCGGRQETVLLFVILNAN